MGIYMSSTKLDIRLIQVGMTTKTMQLHEEGISALSIRLS